MNINEAHMQKVLTRITHERAVGVVSADGDALAACAHVQIRWAKQARKERIKFAVYIGLASFCLVGSIAAFYFAAQQ